VFTHELATRCDECLDLTLDHIEVFLLGFDRRGKEQESHVHDRQLERREHVVQTRKELGPHLLQGALQQERQ